MTLLFALAFAFSAFSAGAPEKSAPVTVACMGDSITFGSGCSKEERWSSRVQEILGGKFDVQNYGIGGRTMLASGDQPYIKTKEYENALNARADIYLIGLGTNDSKPVNWDSHKKDFVKDAGALIASVRKNAPAAKIFLLTPIPSFKPTYKIRGEVIEKEIVPLVKEIAKKNRCKIIDTFSVMQGHLKRAGNPSDLLYDGVHPSPAGHQLMADFIAEKLRSRK